MEVNDETESTKRIVIGQNQSEDPSGVQQEEDSHQILTSKSHIASQKEDQEYTDRVWKI